MDDKPSLSLSNRIGYLAVECGLLQLVLVPVYLVFLGSDFVLILLTLETLSFLAVGIALLRRDPNTRGMWWKLLWQRLNVPFRERLSSALMGLGPAVGGVVVLWSIMAG